MVISSYSILTIRDYLVKQGVENMANDLRWIGENIRQLKSPDDWPRYLSAVNELRQYDVAVFDASGNPIFSRPDTAFVSFSWEPSKSKSKSDSDQITTLSSEKSLGFLLAIDDSSSVGYVALARSRSALADALTPIRHIIYSGMLFSTVLIIVVSRFTANSIAKPINDLTKTAERIAFGDLNERITLKRKDEFGRLAQSLNRMAERLREEFRKEKEMAKHQHQFFSDIAHEIRNPLHTLIGSTEMLELPKLDPEKARLYRDNIKNQAERLNNLFSDLLTLQKMDSEEVALHLQSVNLRPMIEKIANWYSTILQEKALEFHNQVENSAVEADADKLEQVLDNLIGNAIKYTKKGNIRVSAFEREPNRVVVQVEDTGPGIAAEHLNHLFDRFYRTDPARSRGEGGTGLGLAIVKSVLERHNTEVKVESTPEKGTRFWFELPRA